ncbi:MAG: hypothetical protein A2381_15335 [Bdellovibrionales bacterium RIFOXYB1_FULL_37_110]|nr:MAG: hypothetical protein A2381_15335 [Bdellovibrionales bacterium RIFOXYB1_FULL_37_110]OFZ63996.1 MAG: hypothetical protein A2577_15955 [Bdellovibrionales bacterium RIFOXYD1_FULL_36_51]
MNQQTTQGFFKFSSAMIFLLTFSFSVFAANNIIIDNRIEWKEVTTEDFLPHTGTEVDCHVLFSDGNNEVVQKDLGQFKMVPGKTAWQLESKLSIDTHQGTLANIEVVANFVVYKDAFDRPAIKFLVTVKNFSSSGATVTANDLGQISFSNQSTSEDQNVSVQALVGIYTLLGFDDFLLACGSGSTHN